MPEQPSALRVWLRRLFPGRFALAGWVLLMALVASFCTRLGLFVFNGDTSLAAPGTLVPVLAVGLIYDLVLGLWWMLPLALLAWLWPARRARGLGVVALVLAAFVALGLAFTSLAEFVFWNEFASRFNFIAVDYLIYTREVLGNIRESYALAPLFAAVGLVAAALFALAARGLWRASQAAPLRFARRSVVMAAYVAATALATVLAPASLKERASDHAEAQQLAGNGPWEFFHAFRSNEIDYARFYLTVPLADASAGLRDEFREGGAEPHFTGSTRLPIEREVRGAGPAKRLNVVMISVESLSADYLGVFGNPKGLTPRLDALAGEGLLFTQLYATGTRTVRGLEALALSLPPTPGHSVVKRQQRKPLHRGRGVC